MNEGGNAGRQVYCFVIFIMNIEHLSKCGGAGSLCRDCFYFAVVRSVVAVGWALGKKVAYLRGYDSAWRKGCETETRLNI